MADRNFQKKKRNTGNRKRKPVMLITAEGKNKTEQLYFTSFQSQYGKYSVKYVKTSKDTDPAGMYKSLDAYWKSTNYQRRVGIYCKEGRLDGAMIKGKTWLIPSDSKKPEDPRRVRKKDSEYIIIEEIVFYCKEGLAIID